MNAPDKAALIARIAETRTFLGEDLAGLGRTFDVPDRLRRSFHSHPVAWVSSAIALGAVAGSFLRRGLRPGKGGKEGDGIAGLRPLILGALGYVGNQLMTLSLPAVKDLVEAELLRWTRHRSDPAPSSEEARQSEFAKRTAAE